MDQTLWFLGMQMPAGFLRSESTIMDFADENGFVSVRV